MSVQPWYIPLLATLSQTPGEAEPPAAYGENFILAGRMPAPIGTLASIPLGGWSGGDKNYFIAPYDMTVKHFMTRNTREGGLRQIIEYFVIVNGVSTTIATEPVGHEGAALYTPNIAISAGDVVSLRYTCGNNYDATVAVAFYFEGASKAAAPFAMIARTSLPTGTSNGFYFGDSDASYIISPAMPVETYIKRVDIRTSYNSTVPTLFTLYIGSIAVAQVPRLPGQAHVTVEGNWRVSPGQVLALSTTNGDATSGFATATILAQAGTGAGTRNRSIWSYHTDNQSSASSFYSQPIVAPADGKITSISMGAQYVQTVSIYLSKNGGAATTIFSGYLTGGTAQSLPLDIPFSKGDTLDITHSGNGLVGAGWSTWFGVEFDAISDIKTVFTPGGDAQTWAFGADTATGNATALKGYFIDVIQPRLLTDVMVPMSADDGPCEFIIVTCDGNKITEIVYRQSFASSNANIPLELTEPFLFLPGLRYAVLVSRTDGGTTLHLKYFATTAADPHGHFTHGGMARGTAANLKPGQSINFSSANVYGIDLTTEAVSLVSTPTTFPAYPAVGPYRYWRLFPLASGDGSWWSLAELQMRTTIGGADITTEGQAIEGIPYGAAQDASQAFDNDLSSYWLNARSSSPYSWVGQDFGSPVQIAEIALTARTGVNSVQTPTHFRFQFSSDGRTWYDALNVYGQTSYGDGETRVFAIP